MASASRPYIAVIGGANVDIMARHDGLVLNDTDSNPGQMMLSAGGVARNVAENLARLGSDVQLITSLGDDDFATTVNTSVNSTITRSINTSVTTLLVLLSVLFFGGETIRSFILALSIGVFVGTYSSLCRNI